MEIRKIKRSDVPPMVKDKYKHILSAIKELGDTGALEISLSETQNADSLKVTLYRMARNVGYNISITQRIVDGKLKLYVYRKVVIKGGDMK